MTDHPIPDSKAARKPMTAERLRELVHYDPASGIMTWVASGKGRTVGAALGTKQKGPCGRLIARVDYGIYYVHRLAFLYMAGRWPAELIDHANGDPLDNRWANLREATRAENSQNRGASRTNTSGAKDVTWFKRESVWRVMLKADGKKHFIGRFRDKAAAIKARDAAVVRLHGAFARLD